MFFQFKYIISLQVLFQVHHVIMLVNLASFCHFNISKLGVRFLFQFLFLFRILFGSHAWKVGMVIWGDLFAT